MAFFPGKGRVMNTTGHGSRMTMLCAVAIGMAVVLITAFNGCKPNQPPQGGFGVISGTVYYMQSQPLIGATVRTIPPSNSVTTDNYANYTILNVRPGIYKVIAEYGEKNSGSSDVTVNQNKTTTAVIIVRPKN
jgi:Carboxypeptidase regulatory-like domain